MTTDITGRYKENELGMGNLCPDTEKEAIRIATDIRAMLIEECTIDPKMLTAEDLERWDFHILSTGGCPTFQSPKGSHGTSDCGGVLHIHYDGGTVWDFLSYNADNYLATDRVRAKLDAIVAKYGCYTEDYANWSMVVYRN